MSSTLYQATGIVLSRRDHKEVDRGYSVLTREHGKIEFLARGGHKPLAKLTPHLEMAAEVELLVVQGKVFHTVAGVERRRSFPKIYEEFSKLLLAQSSLHLVDLGTRTHEYDHILYDEVVEWLSFLDRAPSVSPERAGFLLSSFALKLLAITGYRPELHRCLGCKLGIQAGAYRWHALKGGVVCQNCAERDQEQWFSARPLSDDALKLVRFAMSERFDEQLRPNLPGEALADFHETVESLIISHFPTIPASSIRGACLV